MYEFIIPYQTKYSFGHIMSLPPKIMLTSAPKIVSIFWAPSPISSKHLQPFWCPFLNPHLSTYHAYIGAQIIVILDLGTSAWMPLHTRAKGRDHMIVGALDSHVPINKITWSTKILLQTYLLRVCPDTIPIDHQRLSIVYQVGIHVHFSSIIISSVSWAFTF
jgi:hypothetical protein